jgi:hypothetical protein
LTQFDAVHLDSEAGTLVWPDGADFDPAMLHDWPRVRSELERRAAEWLAASEQRARMEPTRP